MDRKVYILIALVVLHELALASAHYPDVQQDSKSFSDSYSNYDSESDSEEDIEDSEMIDDDDPIPQSDRVKYHGFEVEDCDCSLQWFRDKVQQVDSINYYNRESRPVQELIQGYLKCKSQLADNLKDAVNRMPAEDREVVELLADDVIMASIDEGNFYNDEEDDVDAEELKNGLEKFISKQIDTLWSNQGRDQNKTITEVDAKIESVCKKALSELRANIEILDILGNRDEVTDNVDQYSREWITRGRVCEILLGSKDLIEGSRENVYIEKQLKTNEFLSKLYDEWTGLKAKVFAKEDEGSEIAPVDLLEYLKRMDEVYSELNNLGLMNAAQQWYASKLKDLIEFGNVDEAKCRQETFERFRVARLINDIHPKTVFPFLIYFGEKQHTICKPIIEPKLNQAISELTDEEKEEIEELSDKVFGSNFTRFSSIPNEVIIKGALNFLKSRAKLDNKSTLREIDQVFERQLDGLCDSVITKFKDFVGAYEAIMSSEGLKQLVEPKSLTWTYRYGMCDTLAYNRPKVVRGVQKALIDSSVREKSWFFN